MVAGLVAWTVEEVSSVSVNSVSWPFGGPKHPYTRFKNSAAAAQKNTTTAESNTIGTIISFSSCPLWWKSLGRSTANLIWRTGKEMMGEKLSRSVSVGVDMYVSGSISG